MTIEEWTQEEARIKAESAAIGQEQAMLDTRVRAAKARLEQAYDRAQREISPLLVEQALDDTGRQDQALEARIKECERIIARFPATMKALTEFRGHKMDDYLGHARALGSKLTDMLNTKPRLEAAEEAAK